MYFQGQHQRWNRDLHGSRPHGNRCRVVWMVRSASILWAAVTIFTSSGCAKYEPMPITSKTVAASMVLPDVNEVRILAASIRHPLLKPVAFDDRDGLSPDEAAILAVLANPTLRAVRDQRALADAQLLQAGLLPNPELSYAFEVPTGGETGGTVNAFELGFRWELTSLIAHSTKVNALQAHSASVDLDIAWQEWQVAQDCKANVYKLECLDELVTLKAEAQQRLVKNLALVRKAVAHGVKVAADLSAAEAASRKAEADLLDLRKQIQEQRLVLNRSLGLSPEAEVRLQHDIELPSTFAAPSAEALLDDIDQRRLDLVALRRGYESQEQAVRAAILEQFPRIAIGPTIGRDVENVDTAGIGLSVELPIFDRGQGHIAMERATRQTLFDEYVERVFEVQADIHRILLDIGLLNRQIALGLAAQADLDRLAANDRTALEAGRMDALNYNQAVNDQANNIMIVLVLKGRLAETIVALELATGMYHVPQSDDHTAGAGVDREMF